MGKGKPKTTAPTAIGQEFSTPTTATNGNGDHTGKPLADSIDLDGLTEEHLEEYTKLLHERARLEKEKEELEKKTARYQAERALLNEDSAAFDRLFKLELGGEYKFSRDDLCCLDLADDQTPVQHSKGSKRGCDHEICARAKSKGISWREMDTLRLYRTRITTERSQRMKNALRKQRDGDLARVKKEDEEEGTLRNRRSMLTKKLSKIDSGLMSLPENADALLKLTDPLLLEAAKENDVIVKNIRARLDKIRQDVYTGKLTANDARIKLEQASQEMVEAERIHCSDSNALKSATKRQDSTSTSSSATLSSKLASNLTDTGPEAFSKALDIVKNFLSATDPADVHKAIAELRAIFDLSGIMPPDIDKKLQDVKSLLDDPNTKRIKGDITRADGTKLEVENVVDLLILLRSPEDKGLLKSESKKHLDDKTWRMNKLCIEIETKAYADIKERARDPALMTQEMFKMLQEIRADAVERSPIPAVTDFVLEHKTEILSVSKAVRGLYAWDAVYGKVLEHGATDAQLQTFPDIVQRAQEWESSIEARIASVIERLAGTVDKKIRVLERLERELTVVARDTGYEKPKFAAALASIREVVTKECSPKSPVSKKSQARLQKLEELMTADGPKSDVVSVAQKVVVKQNMTEQVRLIEQIRKGKAAEAAERAAEMERSQSNMASSSQTDTTGPSQTADAQSSYTKKKRRRSRKPKLKEVPVSTPQIEEGMAQASLHDDSQKEETEDAGKGKGKEKEAEPEEADAASGLAGGQAGVSAIMTPSELKWKQQITDMAVNLGKLLEASEILEGIPDAVPAELRGIPKKLQDQFKQHLDNAAFMCRCKPEWVGLKAWLEVEYRKEVEDDDEE